MVAWLTRPAFARWATIPLVPERLSPIVSALSFFAPVVSLFCRLFAASMIKDSGKMNPAFLPYKYNDPANNKE